MGALSKRLGLASRRVLIVTAVAATLVAAGSAAATARVRSTGDHILAGTRIDGIDVSGFTRAEAATAVQRHVNSVMNSRITLTARGESLTVTPAQLGRRADVGSAVDRAVEGPKLGWLSNLWHRATGTSVHQNVALPYNDTGAQVASVVGKLAGEADVPVQDAGVTLVNGHVAVHHAHTGWSVDQRSSALLLSSALLAGRTAAVQLPIARTLPRVSDGQVGTINTITINVGTNTLELYKGLKVVKRYPVATARPGFTTPRGSWKVMDKIVNPTWTNPAPSGWGAGMPAFIGPGPGNPLGTRALALNAPGILIHGTYSEGSVGTYASHGCIRMHIADSEDLFPRVTVGTKVLVTSG
jgi:lipoprotein-anchoring transpeptidase ErfK/SrfK